MINPYLSHHTILTRTSQEAEDLKWRLAAIQREAEEEQ